jgi:hypothetical protein
MKTLSVQVDAQGVQIAKSVARKRRFRRVPLAVFRRRVHPARWMKDVVHRREVERYVKFESGKLAERAPKSGKWYRATKTATSKARSYQSCGQYVEVRVCGACGVGREGTGVLTPGIRQIRCDMKCCIFCGRYKAKKMSHILAAKIATMPLSDPNFGLWFITVTEKSRPNDPSEYTAERLAERVEALRGGLRALWDPKRHLGVEMPGRLKLGDPISTAMFERIEISDNGAIHAHVIYYGPYRVKEQVEAILKKAWCDAGFVDIKHIANNKKLVTFQTLYGWPESKLSEEHQEIMGAIREVAKYAVKGPSPLDENHLVGEPRKRIDPHLAAKYEIATYCQRLVEWRGVLRRSNKEEAELENVAEAAIETQSQKRKREHEHDQDVACGSCGVVGAWEWGVLRADEFVRRCHARGKQALTQGRWKPP